MAFFVRLHTGLGHFRDAGPFHAPDARMMDMDEKPNIERRWFRFSLRTLLFLVTIAGCGFAWFESRLKKQEPNGPSCRKSAS